ncbi:MAG: AMP-binding protein [Dysgonamonadaceae bacterium]|nr:AMP-binding protein [Dysgonamonadaceae bacterium]
MSEKTFLGLIEQSLRNNWNSPAMTDYNGKTLSYKDFAQEIDKLHAFFHAAGIKKGDKISIAGRNSAHWAIVFFATMSYGAVAVNILHEFDKDSVQYIVDHSDSETFFVDEAIWTSLNEDAMPKLKAVFSLDQLTLLKSTDKALKKFDGNAESFFADKYKNGFFVNDLVFRTEKSEDLAVINYTSGTMSSPKGVMIPYRSLWSNTKFANDSLPFVTPGSDIVCMLPMAHMYGLAFEVLNSISMGCHIHFLGKTPSPKILIDTFAQVKPKLILAVPLIIEKIVTKNVFPKINQGAIKTLRKIPGVNLIVNRKIRQSMMDVFGGAVVEVVIGGAALNPEVEKFLRAIRFPYTVGYGMTECGPLISYAYWADFKERSCGKVVDRMQVKIESPDPENEVGEILAKGINVMLGYYKNPEATAEVLTADGWLKTGDLGIKDKDDFVFIRGRNKNMFLGASGQNIYPEEIEDKLNNSPYVAESIVIHEDGSKIVALVMPDVEALEAEQIAPEQYESFFNNLMQSVNAKLPGYSQIASVRIREEEFEKTPKRSIRRFKYQ